MLFVLFPGESERVPVLGSSFRRVASTASPVGDECGLCAEQSPQSHGKEARAIPLPRSALGMGQ